MATLVPCLVVLRAEFNELFPLRDKGSDGWIGDSAHQARDSDHNPDSRGLVHAIDVDAGLGEGASMQAFADFVVGRCRSGAEKRLTYVIFNRRIASASHGWTWRPYTGSSPHTEHAHFSADDVPAREQDTRPWHLEDVPVALTQKDKDWIADRIDQAATDAAQRVWATRLTDYTDDDTPKRQLAAGTWLGYADGRRNDVIAAVDAATERVIERLGT